MYNIYYTTKFKKDMKKIIKRGYNLSKLESVIALLVEGIPLPETNKDHGLTGNWEGFRECHVEPDWLLIYQLEDETITLTLARTGTHSDLF